MDLRLTTPTLSTLLLAALACSDGPAATPDATTDAPADGDAGVGAPALGTITVLEDRWINPDDGNAFASGRVLGYYLDAAPIQWHREEARVGDCALKRFTPASCTPACSGDQVCVATNTCQTSPGFHGAGRLTLTGLAAPLSLADTGGYYSPTDVIPSELFADGATVTATLAGGAVPGHTVTVGGVPPLVAAIGDKRTLTPGAAHTITWTPAGGDARVALAINANNRGHGAPFEAIIACDVPDSAGSITIAAALVDAFPETRAWTVCAGSDCPPSVLRRYRRATAAIPGGVVELIVGSQVSFGVDHLP